MQKFVDELSVRLKAGNGGAGAVSFRTEKYVPMGGPDGGDGGKGGDVYIVADSRIINLSHFHSNRLYVSKNGQHGMGRNRNGKNGDDLVLKVPIGTSIYDENGDLIVDCIDEEPRLICEGARGGKGNAFFKSSTMQTPRFAQPGEETEEIQVTLSLKMIADIGLVGLPNAGKSTLLKALTHAAPKIGNYPFTTLSPNLGTLEISPVKTCVIADIPGIIEGASKGHGLGISFLKHIERVQLIIFVLDVTMADVEAELSVLRKELESYNPALNERPFLIVFNKCDLIDPEFEKEWLDHFREMGLDPIAISAAEKKGFQELLKAVESALTGV